MVSTTTATILLTGTVVALAIQEGPMTEYLPLLIAGFVVAFVLAFAVGANDVANSFGTAVGSGVVTLKQACILASVFETLGCVFLGAKVGATIRTGIIDVNLFKGTEKLLMAGSFSAMVGSAAWHLVASFFKLPISGTHSIVGATIGFSLVANGLHGVNWRKLVLIVASWFLSPLLSGVMSGVVFHVVRRFILQKEDPVPNGLKALPVFYAFTMGVNVFSIMFTGAPMLGFDKIPWWGDVIVSLGLAALTGVLVWFVGCPYLKRKIEAVAAKPRPGSVPDQEKEVDKRVLDGQAGAANLAEADGGGGMPVYVPGNSYSQYHTVHKGSDLHRDLMHHQNTNSYTSYAMAITGMHGDLKHREGVFRACEEGDEGPGSAGLDRKLVRVDNHDIRDSSEDMTPEGMLEGHVTLDMAKEEEDNGGGDDDDNNDNKLEKDRPEVAALFQSLQIVTACFEAFAHGGNDVSNAVGPLVALWMVFSTGSVVSKAATPVWLLLYGGVGISAGLCVWGRRVMQTLGRDLTPITPSSGFSIELASALTVLFASNVGLPVSTTHCQVGSVVAVGWLRSRTAVDWRLFRNIFLAWVFTVPITGLISAAIMAVFTRFMVE